MLGKNQLLLIKLLSSQIVVKGFLDVWLYSQFFYLFLEKDLTDIGLISGN